MARPPDCGAPPPDPNDPAFLAATQWLIGTPADVDELIDMARGMLERELSGGSTSLMPQLLVKVRTQPDEPSALILYALAVDFNTTDEKHALMRRLGRDLYTDEKIPVAACMVTEAWTSTQAPGAPRIEPRLDPNRREVLIAQAATNGAWSSKAAGTTRMVRIPVRRDAGNRFVADGPAYDSASDPVLKELRAQLLRVFFMGFIEISLRKLAEMEGHA